MAAPWLKLPVLCFLQSYENVQECSHTYALTQTHAVHSSTHKLEALSEETSMQIMPEFVKTPETKLLQHLQSSKYRFSKNTHGRSVALSAAVQVQAQRQLSSRPSAVAARCSYLPVIFMPRLVCCLKTLCRLLLISGSTLHTHTTGHQLTHMHIHTHREPATHLIFYKPGLHLMHIMD